MERPAGLRRREFLALLATPSMVAADAGPLRFGHRQANMVTEPGPAVFDLARQIHGLGAVELQVYFKATTLCDKDIWPAYLRASERAGLPIPSIAGIWPPGGGLMQAGAEEHILNSITAAKNLKSSTILIATFEQNCPDMDNERSYGPIVALLQKVAPAARDAGVTLSMETSNTPAQDKKLVDLVDRPNVRVYYDLFNVEHYQHRGQAVPGVKLLGQRIRQVHLKNEDRLLEQPGPVDWAAAVKNLAKIHYSGWFVFETSHTGPTQCIEATEKNIEFVSRTFVQSR